MKEKRTMKIGRANDADVRMTDISISRNHAFFKYSSDGIYLEDNGSKFGTLVQLQNNVMFLPNKIFALQSGKIYITIKMVRTFIGWMLCYHNKELDSQDFNDYFKKQTIKVEEKVIENINFVVK